VLQTIEAFRHEALLYAGEVDFLARTLPFIREGGRGLWLVNQLCDLVQLRSSAAGGVVRLHMRRLADL
jgi:anti-sigma regulatory factor (Ser/Thr protein kinase)